MIGVITTDGTPITLSLRTRTRRSLQKRAFPLPKGRGGVSISHENCQRPGTLALKTYRDVNSLTGEPVKTTFIATDRYEVDDALFGTYEVVFLEHGFFCAGSASHGENLDPWGRQALARLVLNLIENGGSIVVRQEEDSSEILDAFWPARKSSTELKLPEAEIFLSGGWAFLRR
jgi:hypothetical protein